MIPISPSDCKHIHTCFIAAERGPDGRRAHAYVCRRCGTFVVGINGERMTFTLPMNTQVEAAGQYARYLQEAEHD